MRKKLLLAFPGLLFLAYAHTQEPANWSFSAKKAVAKKYEIHLTVSIQPPWHIYSQSTPEGGPVATKISFANNPLVIRNGSIKESGTMIKKHEEVFGIDVHYYNDKVTFVQTVKLKSAVKTNLSRNIEYMVCNDQQCLPPKKISFTIALN